jgi:hypothetical protein
MQNRRGWTIRAATCQSPERAPSLPQAAMIGKPSYSRQQGLRRRQSRRDPRQSVRSSCFGFAAMPLLAPMLPGTNARRCGRYLDFGVLR